MEASRFEIIHDYLDRYPVVCREILAAGLKHGEAYDSCFIPIWVNERKALMVLDRENHNVLYGVIQWNPELEPYGHLHINWAYSKHPLAMTIMVLRLRKVAKELGATGFSFSVLAGNNKMSALAGTLRAKIASTNYEISIPKARAKT